MAELILFLQAFVRYPFLVLELRKIHRRFRDYFVDKVSVRFHHRLHQTLVRTVVVLDVASGAQKAVMVQHHFGQLLDLFLRDFGISRK